MFGTTDRRGALRVLGARVWSDDDADAVASAMSTAPVPPTPFPVGFVIRTVLRETEKTKPSGVRRTCKEVRRRGPRARGGADFDLDAAGIERSAAGGSVAERVAPVSAAETPVRQAARFGGRGEPGGTGVRVEGNAKRNAHRHDVLRRPRSPHRGPCGRADRKRAFGRRRWSEVRRGRRCSRRRAPRWHGPRPCRRRGHAPSQNNG